MADMDRIDTLRQWDAPDRAFAVGIRADGVSREMMPAGKHPIYHCGRGGVFRHVGNDFGALGDRKRAAEIRNSCKKDIEAAEQTQLTVRILQFFGYIERLGKGDTDSLAVALREHQGQSERPLQLHLAPGPAVGVLERRYGLFTPPMAFAQERQFQE